MSQVGIICGLSNISSYADVAGSDEETSAFILCNAMVGAREICDDELK